MKKNGGKSIEIGMMQKFTDLTLDVIGICAFGYDFHCVSSGKSEESIASNTILSANFNIVRRSFEEMIPLLKIIPSKERSDLKNAENIFYGLIKKVLCNRLLIAEYCLYYLYYLYVLHGITSRVPMGLYAVASGCISSSLLFSSH